MIRLITLTVLSVCALGSLFVQNSYPQSERIYAQYSKEDDLCRGLLKSQKVKDAEPACMAAARLAERLGAGRELEKMSAYEHVGHVRMKENRYQDAIVYYTHALEAVHTRLTDRNAEVGQLYWDLAMAHHNLRNLDKARELYRKAEKTYQIAYADIDPEKVTEDGIEMKRSYLRALRRIFEAHLLAAEQAGATNEAEEIQKQLKSLSNDISS